MKRLILHTLLVVSGVAALSSALRADLPTIPLAFKKIWNGIEARPGEFSDVFFISMNTNTGEGSLDQLCSGVLVHPKLILTAAHCFKNNSIELVGNGTQSARKKFQGTTVSVSRRKAHPQYRAARNDTLPSIAESAKHDIAFIVLRQSLTGITLPGIQFHADPASANELVGKSVRLVGYGLDTYKRVLVIDSSIGIKRYGDNTISQALPGIIVMNEKSGGALPGDSGGPVFLESGGSRTVIGLLHSLIQSRGQYRGSTAHLFSPESLCWVKTQSGIDFLPSLACPTGESS